MYSNATPLKNTFQYKRRSKDTQLLCKYIVRTVEKATGKSYSELKKEYSEEKLFYVALYHFTGTKKEICTAFNIPIEAGCRYKRTFEKEGKLIQSKDEFICRITKHSANRLTTNPKEFATLLKSNTNQLTIPYNEQ